MRAPRPQHAAPISIEILNWRDYVGESRGGIFTKIPIYFHTEKDLDLSGDLFKFFFRLVYLAARQRTPGVIRSTPIRLSRECLCHPESVLSYLPRLIECQLIQEVTSLKPPRVEESRQEERREKAASLPDWIFENVGLTRYAVELENTFLSRERFGRGIFQVYPKQDPEAFDRAHAYLSKIVHDERWLAFIQTCLRNYERRKRAAEERPMWHGLARYFSDREWWNDFRKDNGTIPANFSGSGPFPEPAADPANPNFDLEHNISSQNAIS